MGPSSFLWGLFADDIKIGHPYTSGPFVHEFQHHGQNEQGKANSTKS